MADSTTNLQLIAQGQAQKEETANELFNAMSPAALGGRDRYTSSGLTWGYYGGNFLNGSGAIVSIANDTITLDPSATNYVEMDSSGVVSSNTSGFTGGSIPLYEVVTDASAATSWDE